MTSVVVDASAVLALSLREPAGELIAPRLRAWATAGTRLHAPNLLPYEWSSGVTRAVATGRIHAEAVDRAWQTFSALPIEFHDLADGGFVAAVEIAVQLGRRSAYDAAYLALARHLGAELWTLDTALYRNANAIGFDVKLFA